MLMTGAALTLSALLLLLSGQNAEDRQAYKAYEVQLAHILATEASSATTSPVATSQAAASAAAPGACILVAGSGNLATTQDCVSCHGGYQQGHSHPVDVAQDSTRSRSLRPAAEVVKRGVFLADGKVTCLSCHDGNSPYKAKLALPPDAQLQDRVKPGRPETYSAQTGPLALRKITAATGRQQLPAGTEVSPTPLCKACHAFD
jgi:hypothetical protein